MQCYVEFAKQTSEMLNTVGNKYFSIGNIQILFILQFTPQIQILNVVTFLFVSHDQDNGLAKFQSLLRSGIFHNSVKKPEQ